MALEPIKFIKNWFKNTRTREENWDEIATKMAAYSVRTNNNLKQLGLDLDGSDYNFNNVGRTTQTTPIVDRLDTLESTINAIGTRNLGISLASQDTVAITGSDGTALSSSNEGIVTFNETSDAGDLVTREVIANVSLTLTGCHWGFDTEGDLTDYRLWVLWMDDGSDAILGVAAEGGRETVTAADAETVASNVNSIEKVYTSATVSSTLNCTYMGWIKANFDDTGHAGGENYWTIQNSTGDVNIGSFQTFFEGEVRF
jgi:hypothetical protein